MTFWEATCTANENDFQTSTCTRKSQLDLTRNYASLFYSPWVEVANNSVCMTPLALVKKNKQNLYPKEHQFLQDHPCAHFLHKPSADGNVVQGK